MLNLQFQHGCSRSVPNWCFHTSYVRWYQQTARMERNVWSTYYLEWHILIDDVSFLAVSSISMIREPTFSHTSYMWIVYICISLLIIHILGFRVVPQLFDGILLKHDVIRLSLHDLLYVVSKTKSVSSHPPWRHIILLPLASIVSDRYAVGTETELAGKIRKILDAYSLDSFEEGHNMHDSASYLPVPVCAYAWHNIGYNAQMLQAMPNNLIYSRLYCTRG